MKIEGSQREMAERREEEERREKGRKGEHVRTYSRKMEGGIYVGGEKREEGGRRYM